MITKFTTVYAGHVDLPDRGQNATPANERRYSNEHLASVFDKTEARLKAFEERYPGMQHISLSNPIGTPEAIMLEQFQWLSEEVMPAFKPAGR
jgi:hypothetical protein